MLTTKQYSSYDELSLESAQFVYGKIKTKIQKTGKFNLGLAAGNSPKGMYKHLIHLLSVSRLDLSGFHTINLDEYYPISQTEDHSFFQKMYHSFWQPLSEGSKTFDIINGHIMNGEAKNAEKECDRYETLIKNLGGIDLQVLGLGNNGHIGFNEPMSKNDSRTRKIELTTLSKNILSSTFPNGETVPKYALTMGIGTILEAREIVLIAVGESKKGIFQKLQKLEKPTPEIPASFLLDHLNTTVFTDLS